MRSWLCPKYTKFQVCNIFLYLKENVKDEVDFCLKSIIEDFPKLVLSFHVRVARNINTIQNSKVAFSLQYIKEEMSNEIDFFHVDNHESSYKLALIFDWNDQTFPKFPKFKLAMSLQYI